MINFETITYAIVEDAVDPVKTDFQDGLKMSILVTKIQKRVLNTKRQFTCFYYTQEQIVLPRHFLVVEYSFLPEKVKLEMGITVKRQFMMVRLVRFDS